jgi:NADH-quinone oxidoreductase subunit H
LNPVLEVVLRSVCVLVAFLVLPLAVGQTEHKVMAHMQGRLGPMYAGGFHGWAQLVADGAKFVQKEDITPRAADRWVFKLAPGVALVPYLVALSVIPLSATVVAANVGASALFVLAASAVGILGLLMAGWSSANKYALLGGMRAAAQLLSYELPLVLAVASVALAAGSVSLTGIAEAWSPLWLLWQLPGALVFLIAGVAELQRSPFDMPLADSEIVRAQLALTAGWVVLSS